MRVKDILRVKGKTVHTIASASSLAEVVRKMVEHNCGSLVVVQGQRMIGIITERDILRTCADTDQPLAEMSVDSRMTKEVATATAEDDVNDVMGLLTDKRIRHLPVLLDGELAGMISIGDVVKAQHDHLRVENHFLKSYIQS